MNVQMMDGLLGASSNIRLAATPMSVYHKASAEGDTEKMKRALGYTGECTEKAAKYQEKLDEGIKAEAKDEREKVKLEQEDAIEKRERKRAEESAEPDLSRETDRVQISGAAKAALRNSQPLEAAGPAVGEPVIYTPAGGVEAAAEAGPNVSFTA